MFKIFPGLRLPICIALTMHLLLVVLLSMKSQVTAYRMPNDSLKIVHATAVSQTQIDTQIREIHKAQAQVRAKVAAKKKAEIAAAKALEAQKIAEKNAQLKLAREKKEKREKILKMKQEKIREAQKKALLAKAQKLQDEMMRQQMQSEQKALQQITSQVQQGVINKYKAQIISLIQSNWRIHQLDASLSCVYDISVGPGGVVLSVQLIKSSGSEALDQSARAAILQSSPLPVPSDGALFDHFRHLVLTLSPRGYTAS